MTIAIVGGTGFLGPEIARRLLARGVTPLVIARGKHPVALPDGAIFAAADRMDSAALIALFKSHAVTAVIDVFSLSLRNTQPVLDAVATTGARYVLVSSTDVYSNYEGLIKKATPPIRLAPATEDSPLRTIRYPYRANTRRPQGVEDDLFEDYDKLPIEDAARADRRFVPTIIRAPMIFGPGDKQHRFKWAVDAAIAGGVAKLDARAGRWPNSYGYIVDVAEALALAATDPRTAGRTYNVGQPFVRTPIEWLLTFAVILNRSLEVETVPPADHGLQWERAEASDLRYPLTLDTTRIRDELGFAEIVPEREALLKTIAWEQSQI